MGCAASVEKVELAKQPDSGRDKASEQRVPVDKKKEEKDKSTEKDSKMATKSRSFKLADANVKVTDVYDIGRTLGTGGFAVVRKGRHKKTAKEVAIKVMELPKVPEQHGQKLTEKEIQAIESRDAILREIDILADLDHPNVLHLKEYFIGKNHVYLVTELLKGGELLDALLDQGGQYSEADAKLCFKKILEGINYLHQKKVVHRDLKLENLLLAKSGDLSTVQIADFGLAKRSTTDAAMDTMCGSPMYIAPEVISTKAGVGYSPAVDCWSAGVILYILLSGEPPFDDRNESALFQHIQTGSFEFSAPVWDAVSSPAKDLIKKLLNVNHQQRFSAQQALDHPWCATEASGDDRRASLVPLSVTQGALKKYADKMRLPVKIFKEGEFLIRQGDVATEAYIIQTGVCKVIVTSGDGTETIVAERKAGDMIGEMAIMDGDTAPKRRTASVKATSTVSALVMQGMQMNRLLQEDQVARGELNATIEERQKEVLVKQGK
mmetsp:Transcript_38480/g.46443  ORF Transcript_38480/g.46443 Transcript_38480/m.46443 type:complete len:493 (+) Transcript_38480:224-1702(+)|eukprot:CAMPEP_0197847386 /NCGR_PEP_ID=MMETSP1438-20131217/5867_1 /TAXON_ID=1461541 /ORGANISM="Pterosperma sp., Strain CCMP1384" /LENGTH=492 /DNA_ID=CAMNT_0043459285 /DNA_START=224 /DNA_END=1702 /DNA_ORIENTATION=+